MAKYDELGREIPDPTPIELPLGFKKPPTMQEMIAQAIRTQMSDMAAAQGMETFEEANDFDVMDEGDLPVSKHEIEEEDDFQRREMELLDRAGKDMEELQRGNKGGRSDERENDGGKGGVGDRRGRDVGNGARSVDNDAGKEGGKGDSSGSRGVDKGGNEAA